MKLEYAIYLLLVTIFSCHIRDFRSENINNSDTKTVTRFVQFFKEERQIASFRVEIASTDEERQKGLMFRKSLEEDAGMLFIFDNNAVRSFWMKNTYIPLDLVFINSDMNVVGIYKNATPLSEDTISIERPSRYVLEINAGLSDKYGIDTETKAVFINIF